MLFSGGPSVIDPAGLQRGEVDLRTMTDGELTYLARGVAVSIIASGTGTAPGDGDRLICAPGHATGTSGPV